MKKLLKVLSLLGALSLGMNAQADDIYLGEPGYGGNGCPAGTASVTLSPDQKSLSILFDEYIVETTRRRRTVRKSCNIAVPVHIPQGFSVSVIDIDYRGYNSLPRRAFSRFSVEYFFAGVRGPVFRKTFRGELDADFTLGNQLTARSMIWSRCGADVNLRVTLQCLLNLEEMKQ